jgi:hypothetical protein
MAASIPALALITRPRNMRGISRKKGGADHFDKRHIPEWVLTQQARRVGEQQVRAAFLALKASGM